MSKKGHWLDKYVDELRQRRKTGEHMLGMTPRILRAIGRKIERWLRGQPQVKISAEVIFDYVFSLNLPAMFDDDGVMIQYNFHPPAATDFALLWAAVWLYRNPHAEINNAEEWAGAVKGGNQVLRERSPGSERWQALTKLDPRDF